MSVYVPLKAVGIEAEGDFGVCGAQGFIAAVRTVSGCPGLEDSLCSSKPLNATP